MKKNERLEAWLDAFPLQPNAVEPRELQAYLWCFHNGRFYEAHDVLEHLWLRCSDESRSLYQGLIQIAGAFVHFQKNAHHPTHPTHSKRVAPGRRLLLLAHARLLPFAQPPAAHAPLDLRKTCELCLTWAEHALHSNPLLSLPAPHLPLLSPIPFPVPTQAPPLMPLTHQTGSS